MIDCPKMAEALWPAAFQPPRALATAPEPTVEQTGGVGGAVVAAEVAVVLDPEVEVTLIVAAVDVVVVITKAVIEANIKEAEEGVSL